MRRFGFEVACSQWHEKHFLGRIRASKPTKRILFSLVFCVAFSNFMLGRIWVKSRSADRLSVLPTMSLMRTPGVPSKRESYIRCMARFYASSHCSCRQRIIRAFWNFSFFLGSIVVAYGFYSLCVVMDLILKTNFLALFVAFI